MLNTQYTEFPKGTVYTIPYQVCFGVDLHYVPLTNFLLGRVPAACQKVLYWVLPVKTAFIIRVSYCVNLEK